MKECYQLKEILPQTNCFRRKGSVPCDENDCLVEKGIQETKTTSLTTISLMLHSRCRISSLSSDNQQYYSRPDIKDWEKLPQQPLPDSK